MKSLVATPSVLAMMSEKLDWTQKLGDAVLAQQPDVMDAVQRLRTKAQANNKLASTKEQKVSVTQQENKQVIVIEPTVPDTVYVPYYEPAVVYGDWPYPDYPAYYFPPPLGYVPGAVLATGIAFGAGYALGRWTSGGNYWGGGVNWGGGNINVNRPVNINNINVGNNNWQHNPMHRQGVKYSNTNVQQKFGNNNVRAGSQDRADFRGRSGEQVLKPGGGAKSWRQGRQPSGDLPTARPATGPTPATVHQRARSPTTNRPRRAVQPKKRPCCRRQLPSATAPWAISNPARWPTRRPRAAGKVSVAALRQHASVPAAEAAAAAVAAGRWRRWRQGGGGGGGIAAAVAAAGTSLGHQRQARHRADRPARQWTWLLSLQLQRQRQSLCRRHGAGGAGGHAGRGRARPGRIPAGLLRQARAEIRDLRPLGCLRRADSIRCRDAAHANPILVIVMTQIFSMLGKLTCWTAATIVLASVSVASAQQSFKSPEDAMAALVGATKDNWPKGVVAVLGPDGADIVSSGDKVAMKKCARNFSRPTTPSTR